jgi:hypothetical protein
MLKQEPNHKHAPGNNYPCDKIKTVEVILERNGILPNQINGQYFFPEMPELNNKTIKGISVTSYKSTLIDYTPLNQGLQVFFYGFITLYNHNNEQIIYNMPLYNLLNDTAGGIGQKILPINSKLNFKLGFVNFAAGQNFPPTLKFTLNLNFYYDYK